MLRIGFVCCRIGLPHEWAQPERTIGAAILLCCVAFLSACSVAPEGVRLARGESVPNLSLKGFDGQSIHLESFRGRLLILNVWAPWCAPCIEEMPSLDRLSRKLDPQRFTIIGLTVDDDRFLAEEFLRNQRISFDNFLDEKRFIAESILDVRSFPQTFVISPDGVLLARIVGWQEWDSAEIISALEDYYRSSRTTPEPSGQQIDRAIEGASV